jgi:type I restriction enzyme S subunit
MSDCLPEDWTVMEFDQFTTLQRGKDLTKGQFRKGTVPVAGSNGIIGYHGTAIARGPGITFDRSGSVGKVTFYEKDFWPHNTSLYVSDFHGNDPGFARYLLTSLNLARFKAGASVPTLDRNSFKSLPVLIVPLLEQKAIAHILAAVHRAIAAHERIIQTTTELKKALMQKLFTEGLRGEPQKETEIGLVPESWEVVPLASLLSEPLRNGHSAKATTDDDGIRTLTLAAVTQRDFSIENTKITCADPHRVRDMWLRSCDIFIERANTADYVGLAALYEGAHDFAIFPDLLIRVRVDNTKMHPKILIEWLLAETCRRYYKKNARSTAGNFPKIDQGTVEKTLIPVPPPEEQKQPEDYFRALDDKIRGHTSYRSALQDLFNTLLHELMSAMARIHKLKLPESVD